MGLSKLKHLAVQHPFLVSGPWLLPLFLRQQPGWSLPVLSPVAPFLNWWGGRCGRDAFCSTAPLLAPVPCSRPCCSCRVGAVPPWAMPTWPRKSPSPRTAAQLLSLRPSSGLSALSKKVVATPPVPPAHPSCLLMAARGGGGGPAGGRGAKARALPPGACGTPRQWCLGSTVETRRAVLLPPEGRWNKEERSQDSKPMVSAHALPLER